MPGKAAKKNPAQGKKPVKGAKKKAVAPVKEWTPFQPTNRNHGIGNQMNKSKDLSRFTRYPAYVQRARKVAILKRRLKVPPTVNQFYDVQQTLSSKNDSATKKELLKLLAAYKPETKKERTERRKDGKADAKPAVTYGVQEVTKAIEGKRAKLVAIASDVDPLEIVVWLPALCRAQGIPYVIVHNAKSTFGQIVHGKTCAVVALTKVNAGDNDKLDRLVESLNGRFLNRYDEIRRTWGGLKLGYRTVQKLTKRSAKVAKRV